MSDPIEMKCPKCGIRWGDCYCKTLDLAKVDPDYRSLAAELARALESLSRQDQDDYCPVCDYWIDAQGLCKTGGKCPGIPARAALDKARKAGLIE